MTDARWQVGPRRLLSIPTPGTRASFLTPIQLLIRSCRKEGAQALKRHCVHLLESWKVFKTQNRNTHALSLITVQEQPSLYLISRKPKAPISHWNRVVWVHPATGSADLKHLYKHTQSNMSSCLQFSAASCLTWRDLHALGRAGGDRDTQRGATCSVVLSEKYILCLWSWPKKKKKKISSSRCTFWKTGWKYFRALPTVRVCANEQHYQLTCAAILLSRWLHTNLISKLCCQSAGQTGFTGLHDTSSPHTSVQFIVLPVHLNIRRRNGRGTGSKNQHSSDSKDLSHGPRQASSSSHSLKGVSRLRVFSHHF